MTDKKEYNIVRNLLLSSVSTFSAFFLFILLSFLGRGLGKETLGVFTTALSIATIFEMFTDFGLRDISIRNVSRDKLQTGRYSGNLLTWKLSLCAIVYLVMLGIVQLMGYDPFTRRIIYLLTLSAFLKSLIYTFRIFFQAHDFFGWDTVVVLAERISLLAFGLAALFRWKAILPIALCFVLVRFLDFLFMLIVIRWKIGPVRPRFEFGFMKKLQIEAFPLGLFFVILTVFSYIDTVMLSLMRPYGDVGLYNAAFRIYEGITIIPTVFWLVFLPRLSEMAETERERHRKLAAQSVKYMVVAGLPTLTIGILFSDFLIHFFFQSEYAAAVPTLKILFLGLGFEYSNWMLNATLISMNRQRVMMFLGLGGLVFKITSNLVLIPSLGYNGSALATALSECLIFTGAVWMLHRAHIVLPVLDTFLKPAGALAALLLFFFLPFPLHPVLRLLFGGSAYIAGLFLLRTFSRGEIGTLCSNMQTLLGKR